MTISVHFDPAAPGSYAGRMRIASDHGGVTVALSGTAVAGRPRLSLQRRTLDFGSVPVGASRTLRFTILDAGNVPLTISRAIAPSEPFAAAKPVPEGLTIGSHTGLQEAITFAPTATGPASGRYVLGGDDGRGYQIVTLVGRGVRKAGAPRGRR